MTEVDSVSATNPGVLSRLDTLRGLRVSTAEGLFATVWAVLTTGAFQTGFALALGATPFQLGLLAGIPSAVGLLQLPASIVSSRLSRRKPWVGIWSLVGRLLWLPILGLPWLVPPQWRAIAFLLLVALSSAALTVTVPAWTSWMSDLVPAESRGRYFGHRNMLAGLATMLVPIPAGWLLDLFAGNDSFLGFAGLFGLACLFAVGAFAMILRQPEPIVHGDSRETPLQSVVLPFRDPDFRRFLGFACVLVAGQGIGGPFFVSWQLESSALALPYVGVQILGGIASAASLMTTQFWGYVTDKYGARPILLMSSVVVAIAPVMWVFTSPGSGWNVPLIVVLSVTAGVGWAAVGLAQFHLLIGTSRPELRAAYVGVFSATTGLVGGIAPIVGGWLMEMFSTSVWSVGSLEINNFKVIFLLSAILRLLAALFLRGVPDGETTPAGDVFKRVLDVRNVATLRHVRRLSSPLASGERKAAIEAIGGNRASLALEEVVAALEDVSPEVRAAAARTLGDLGDSRAVEALGKALANPLLGIGSECAETLARIGSFEATPWLVAALDGPDGRLRVEAIRALGNLGDPEAAPSLLRVLDPSHQTRTETACVAFAQLVPHLPIAVLETSLPSFLRLLASDAPRGVRLAAATVWERISETSVSGMAVPLSHRLREEADPAVAARLAASIARFGWRRPETGADLAAVLHRLSDQRFARTQALLALADWRLGPGKLYPLLGIETGERLDRLCRMLRDRSLSESIQEETRAVAEMISSGAIGPAMQSIAATSKDPVAAVLRDAPHPDENDLTFAVLILLDTLGDPI